MSTITPATLASELAAVTPALNEQEQHLALTVYHLLADGDPVDRQALADRANLTREQVDETLSRWPGVFSDENQRIVGFHGLSILPMPHRLTVDGRVLFAWCAWDTLLLPELLGHPAKINYPRPTTHEPITLTVNGTDIISTRPEETVLSFLHRDEPFDADTITSFCHYVHFFATPAAADEWTARHGGTCTISLTDGIEIARRANRVPDPDARVYTTARRSRRRDRPSRSCACVRAACLDVGDAQRQAGVVSAPVMIGPLPWALGWKSRC